MTDRELLELAAKANGYVDDANDNSAAFGLHRDMDGRFYWIDSNGWTQWNPADDDGQALRLAVKLGMHVGVFLLRNYEPFTRVGHAMVGHIEEEHGNDTCAATRRAIVRTAASIVQFLGEGESK